MNFIPARASHFLDDCPAVLSSELADWFLQDGANRIKAEQLARMYPEHKREITLTFIVYEAPELRKKPSYWDNELRAEQSTRGWHILKVARKSNQGTRYGALVINVDPETFLDDRPSDYKALWLDLGNGHESPEAAQRHAEKLMAERQ